MGVYQKNLNFSHFFFRQTWPSADKIPSKNLMYSGLPVEIIKTEIHRGPVVTTPCKSARDKKTWFHPKPTKNLFPENRCAPRKRMCEKRCAQEDDVRGGKE